VPTYRVYGAPVRNKVTGEVDPELVGDQVTIVTRGTTTPFAIQDGAGDPIPDSALTVQSAHVLPAFYFVSASPAAVYIDWYHAESGDSGEILFEEVLREIITDAAESAAASATSSAASAEAAQAVVTGSMATFLALATHRDDPDFARPDVLGPVLWVGTVHPLNSQSIDIIATGTPPSGGGFVGAFDAPLAAPWRAYSLRRLLSAYSGPLVRVRRSSDDTTLDIGYNSDGTLDSVALLAFTGANNGFVDRWYDQTGGGKHLEQGSLTAQPSIVTAGVVNTLDSLPAVTFDGTNDYLTTATAGLFDAAAATMGLVFSGAAVSNSVVVGESNNGGGGALYRLLRSSTAAMNVQATNGSGVSMWANSVSGDTTFDAAQHQVFYADSGSQINTWRDNVAKHVALAAVRSGTTPLTNLNVGAHLNGGTPANFLNGKVQELVLWNSNQSVDRAAITTAQKTFWGTP
jgi:hypothetical protein